MTPGRPSFPDPPQNPDAPAGQVALKLREILQQSPFDTQRACAEAIGYSTSNIADMLSGRRVQGQAFVKQFVEGCVPGNEDKEQQYKAEIRGIFEAAGTDPVGEEPSLDDPPVDDQSVDNPNGDDPDGGQSGGSDPSGDDTSAGDGQQAGARPGETAPGGQQAGAGRTGARFWQGDGETPWTWSRRNVLAVVVAVVLLAVAIGFAVSGGDPGCGEGIARSSNGECVGVSDASTNITGDLQFDDLFAKISAENQRVLTDPTKPPVVSIAYTAPFPKEPGTALGTQLRQEMEGAYISQLQANGRDGDNPLSSPPRVQLLIANLGDAGTQHATTVAAIAARTDPAQVAPVVGVVGLDQSVPGVKDTIRELGQRRIPMVGGRIVLDNITDDPYRDGFYGVAPSISSQIRAGSAYLSVNKPVTRPMIVVDRNPNDLYGTGLATQLRPILYANSKPGPALTDEPYDASLSGLEATFAQMSQSICIKKPDVIYFAGRGTDLPAFIRGLGQRPCQDVKFTVFTISDGRILAPAVQQENRANGSRLLSAALQSGITVRVTAQAHPGKWQTTSPQFPQGAHALLSNDCDLCFRTLFPGQSLDDGDTIIGYDAMLVAVNAMRRGTDQQNPQVTTQTVRQALARITPQVPVYGASGPIGYTDQAGFPTTKPIPITEITSDGVIIIAPNG